MASQDAAHLPSRWIRAWRRWWPVLAPERAMTAALEALTACAGPQAPGYGRHAVPILEPLEDRTAPAVFTVTGTGDSSAGSGSSGDLRYCLTQANNADGA